MELLTRIEEIYKNNNSVDIANVLIRIGQVYYEQGGYNILPAFHPDYAYGLYRMGQIYYDMNCLTNNLQYRKRALHLREQILFKDHQHIGRSLYELGNIRSKEDDPQGTLEFYLRALEIYRKTFDDGNSTHPYIPAIQNDISRVRDRLSIDL
ncbi:unnamed protein product [Didymodactylos carnosus]|uniref:Uncharacterized protein n=1 Tax=Didymodactylos carnosus TaxID=1234261 RepID=A0A815S8S2_9BILA|nr:unnamed protein product [Didymodactylos carnosus]CAF4352157.1 unnamed protein product [Didymodactylos carnosus]